MFIKLYPAHALDPSEPYKYGITQTAFGPALLISQAGFLLKLGLTDRLEDLMKKDEGNLVQDHSMAETFWWCIQNQEPIKVVLRGTPFQLSVWQALLDLTDGEVVTYKDIALRLGRPTSFRAVANAVGANPLAVVIPCHRVIRSDGGLGGYHWGLDKKKMLLGRDDIDGNIRSKP